MTDSIQQFFDFIYERHCIWHRRFQLKLPVPWTEDPVLQKYKFCNVYRELDRGSQWYIKHIAKEEMTLADRIFRTVVYRYLNHDRVFNVIGVPPLAEYDRSVYDLRLRTFKKDNGYLFNTAYRTYAVRTKGADPIDYFLTTCDFTQRQTEHIAWGVEHALSLKEVWQYLQVIPRVGPFLAYEIVCDLMYEKRIPFTPDDFVNVGPGAIWGLQLMFGELTKDPAEYVKELQKMQGEYLPKIYPGRYLNLRDIEHSLCEFRKYTNLSTVRSHARLFNPHP